MTDAYSLNPSQRATLAQAPLLHGVDLDILEPIVGPWQVRQVNPGESVLNPFQDNEEILILLEGELLVTADTRASHPLARIQTGECVGELSMIDSGRPTSYVIAAEPCRYLPIHRDALWRLIGHHPIVARNLLRILAQRIREKNALLVSSLGLLQEYRSRAETDALTGLRNRSWMMEIFPRQLELSLRIGHPVSLTLIDIDHFKRLNDSLGHAAGDQALRQVARLMTHNLRSTDLLARYGGEEFAVLMPATHVTKARITAERLRRCVAEAPFHSSEGTPHPLTISAGVAECLPGWTLEELMRASDRALYQAKQAGRNQVSVAANPFRG